MPHILLRSPRSWLIALSLLALVAGTRVARAIVFTGTYAAENVTPGDAFDLPTAFAFAPGGRVFVTEKSGKVWAVANGVRQGPFVDLANEVLTNGDRGLLGIAIDPHYLANHFVYLLYTVDPDSDGVDDDGPAFGRLTRYKVRDDDSTKFDPASRTILIGVDWAHGIPSCSDSHTEGALHFAPDGTLLLGAGDGAHYDQQDSGHLDPQAFLPGRVDTSQNVGAFRAQMITSLNGKILRIDPATGLGLPSNPYYDGDPASNASRVWAYGFRNPFRFTLRPGTGSTNPALGRPGVVYIGDVGWTRYESLDAATTGGFDFGWPCFEGGTPNSPYQLAHPAHHDCTTFGTAINPGPFVLPLLAMNHLTASLSIPPLVFGNAIIGGPFYTGSRYPVLAGKYFFADFGANWIKVATLDATDHLVGIDAFASQADGPVDLEADPVSGDLYYLAIFTGELRHIRYTGPAPDHAPVARLTAAPIVGVAPFAVTFDASGSTDADDDPLADHWLFGDGTGASGVNVTHTYVHPGVFAAQVSVDDGQGGVGVDSITIVASASAAFPTTAVLDGFDRAAGPLGSDWLAGATAPVIADSALAPVAGAPSALWHVAFGPDAEAFASLRAIAATDVPQLEFAAADPQARPVHVRVWLDVPDATVHVEVADPDSGSLPRGVVTGATFTAGNRFGARLYENGIVRVFRDSVALGDVAIGERPELLTGVRAGASVAGTGATRLDDFGGGDAIIDPNHPPVVALTSPLDGAFYATGDTLHLRGAASDVEDAPADLAWHWTIDLHHNNHVHPSVFSSDEHAPDHIAENHDDGTGVSLVIQLAVTDLGGRTTKRSVHLYPEVDLSPARLTVTPAVIGTLDPAEYRFWLRNTGRMPAPLSHWVLSAGGQTLAAGDTLVPAHDSLLIVRRVPAVLPAGATTLRVTVDSLGAIVEPNETDDAKVVALTVVTGHVPDVLPPVFVSAPTASLAGSSAWLRWLTDEPSVATVLLRKGAAPWDSVAFAGATLDHDAQLTGLPFDTEVRYQVIARDTLGNPQVAAVDSFHTSPSDLGVDAPPNALALSSAWPDPSRGAVSLTLALPRASAVHFAVYDVAGREVWHAADRTLAPGMHALRWSGDTHGAPAAPGIYLARVATRERTFTRRVVIAR